MRRRREGIGGARGFGVVGDFVSLCLANNASSLTSYYANTQPLAPLVARVQQPNYLRIHPKLTGICVQEMSPIRERGKLVARRERERHTERGNAGIKKIQPNRKEETNYRSGSLDSHDRPE